MPNRMPLALFAIIGSLLGASVAAGAQTATVSPAPVASYAPGQGAAHHHRGGRMNHALRDLNLTTDQRGQIKTLMTSYRASRSTATPQTRQQLMAGINNVLTPAQRTQFATAMARPHRDERMSPMASPSP